MGIDEGSQRFAHEIGNPLLGTGYIL